MTEQPDERDQFSQPDGEDEIADDLAGREAEPDHDADPSSYTDTSDDDEDGESSDG